MFALQSDLSVDVGRRKAGAGLPLPACLAGWLTGGKQRAPGAISKPTCPETHTYTHARNPHLFSQIAPQMRPRTNPPPHGHSELFPPLSQATSLNKSCGFHRTFNSLPTKIESMLRQSSHSDLTHIHARSSPHKLAYSYCFKT